MSRASDVLAVVKEGKRKINQKGYIFYIVLDGARIHSGWEYKEDAKDAIDELPSGMKAKAKIYQRAGLKKFGLDPDDNEVWRADYNES